MRLSPVCQSYLGVTLDQIPVSTAACRVAVRTRPTPRPNYCDFFSDAMEQSGYQIPAKAAEAMPKS